MRARLAILGAVAVTAVSAAPLPAFGQDGTGTVMRLDARIDTLIPADARIETVADGYVFLEGPVWIESDARLLFSDLRGNAIYQWSPGDGPSDYLVPFFSGDGTGLRSVGPNGVAVDPGGRLVVCVYGSRSVVRLEPDGARTTLAERYEGRRLNSPNDLVVAADGTIYFTDPPFGLEGFDDSPLKELDFNGVYRLPPDGALDLLARDLSRPNGLALSPNESLLYVANSGGGFTGWYVYELGSDGAGERRIFHDVGDAAGPGGVDGMKVDLAGNVFATGPGGVWVLAPDGTHLGTIAPGEALTNVGWGDEGRTLYITGRTTLYRIRLNTRGELR